MELCNGVWAPICDSLWSSPDASVVCNQLGYPSDGKTSNVWQVKVDILLSHTEALAFNRAFFGQGIGIGSTRAFLCNGSESDLLQCLHSNTFCEHTSDAGVRCSGITSPHR